jgi:hypothetical protein
MSTLCWPMSAPPPFMNGPKSGEVAASDTFQARSP